MDDAEEHFFELYQKAKNYDFQKTFVIVMPDKRNIHYAEKIEPCEEFELANHDEGFNIPSFIPNLKNVKWEYYILTRKHFRLTTTMEKEFSVECCGKKYKKRGGIRVVWAIKKDGTLRQKHITIFFRNVDPKKCKLVIEPGSYTKGVR